jgi:hypothetical protein
LEYEGTIRIFQSLGGGGARFGVVFSPYVQRVEGGTCGVRRFNVLQQVIAFLKILGVRKDLIATALHQLVAGRSAEIPSVVLSEKVVQRRGLDCTVTEKRRES